MTKVVGIRFRTAGKIYFFDPLQFEIKRGDNVIVETARGIEFGTAVSDAREVTDDKVVQPLKPVLRLANERDRQQEADNKRKEKEAYKICLEKIQKHGLEMKLIDAEYTFDNNKVLFYFTADGRIDFRELVKDLAGVFKTRIELRQIGVRDETKILGGIGICGRPLCCHTHLSDFIPVSIKMAKEQNLSLNPTKISGVCGRLMCCLKHEEDTYEELNRRLPGIGDFVTTEDGLKGQVQSVNVLRQLVKVVVDKEDEKEILEYPVEELRFRRRHSKKEQMELSKEELQELERMEQEDQLESREEQSDSRDGKQERSDRFGEAGAEKRERQERPVRTGRERAGRDRRQEHGQRQQESGERQRYSREGNQDRSERYSREGGQDRSERYSREGSQDRSERYSREGNQDRSERYSREGGQDRSERYSREGSQDRSERYSREGGQSRRGRYERGEGNARRDRGSDRREYQENRPERQGRGERQERGENRRRGDSHSHRQGTPGNRPRRERSDHEWEQND
ncbi:hypothetical protein IMSAGC003_01741 [Lachnospiraceae bacterium]|nr:hypothetical protein IMSAGC003_01741 [Lachnospiraceae bacterium]